MNPTITVPKSPNISPAFLNAYGIAKIPEPKLAFKTLKKALRSLKKCN